MADIYPSLPTWWIPESIVGAVLATLMIFAGLIVSQLEKRIKQLMRNNYDMSTTRTIRQRYTLPNDRHGLTNTSLFPAPPE